MRDSFVKKLENLTEQLMKKAVGDDDNLKRATKLVKVSNKKLDVPELSDAWYIEKAKVFWHDYGRHNSAENWEEIAVDTFCGSLASFYGNIIDRKKLLKAIKDLMKEKDDEMLALPKTGIAVSLKEIANKLRAEASFEEELEKTLAASPIKLIESSLRHSAQPLSFDEWTEISEQNKPGVIAIMETKYGRNCNTFSKWEFLYQRELRLKNK